MTEQANWWWWCMHCERCWAQKTSDKWKAGIPDESTIQRLGHLNSKGDPWLKCPYDDCDGDPKDFWLWEEMLKDWNRVTRGPAKESVEEGKKEAALDVCGYLTSFLTDLEDWCTRPKTPETIDDYLELLRELLGSYWETDSREGLFRMLCVAETQRSAIGYFAETENGGELCISGLDIDPEEAKRMGLKQRPVNAAAVEALIGKELPSAPSRAEEVQKRYDSEQADLKVRQKWPTTPELGVVYDNYPKPGWKPRTVLGFEQPLI